MILYTNLTNVKVCGKPYNHVPVLKLTSPTIIGKINSNNCTEQIDTFIKDNKFSNKQIKTIQDVFAEATKNDFVAWIEKGEKAI